MICLFVCFQVIRLRGPPKIQWMLNTAFAPFLDQKDDGTVVLSHIYLLLGLSLPVWIDCARAEWEHAGSHTVIAYSGIVTVGIGDSFAAIIGSYLGKTRWIRRNRTIEGSFAMFLTQLICLELILCFDPGILRYADSKALLRLTCLVHCVITTLGEALIRGSDNVIIPVLSTAFFGVCYPLYGTTILESRPA